MNLKPLDDRIVVRPNEAETQTASGLVIPEVTVDGEDLLVLNSRDVLAIVAS